MARGDKATFEGVTCIKETDMALLCRFDDGREEWIPKSQIDDDSEVYNDEDAAQGTLVVTQWIAEQKGLV